MRRGITGMLVAGILLALTGCTTIQYTAEKEPMINFKPVENAAADFSYEETQKFFLWGLTPETKEINVTEIARANGAANGLAEVEIEESYTALDVFLSAITCGIYCPRTVTITGKVIGGPLAAAGEVNDEK